MIIMIILLVMIILYLGSTNQKIERIEKKLDEIKFEIDNNFFD